MTRTTVLGIVAAIGFGLAVLFGAIVADAVTDGGGPVAIPDPIGEAIPVIGPEVFSGGVEPDGGGDYVQVEVAGEYRRLPGATLPLEEPTPGPVEPDATGSSPGSGGVPAFEADPPADAADRGYSWDVEELDFDISDLIVPAFSFGLLRWLDFCADNPSGAGCPDGVGGTVLAPFDDTVGVGEFTVARDLYNLPMEWWRCTPPSDLGRTESWLLISASHPARMEISYHPSDDPTATRSTVVDLTDSGSSEFEAFVSATRDGMGLRGGVHHCFALEADRAARWYTIEVLATSFTGETASRTYGFRSSEQRSRPPVQLAPLDDNRATIAVPVKRDPAQRSLVRLISSDEEADCSSIEDAALARERVGVLFDGPGWTFNGYYSTEPMGDVVDGPEWRYDPAYDAYDFWSVSLREGTNYQMCVWWLESGGLRSFDPLSAGVVEREMRWIGTPDRLRVEVRVAGVVAPSTHGIAAGSFRLTGDRPCGVLELPTSDIAEGGGVLLQGGRLLCDFDGFIHPDVLEIRTHAGSDVREFLIDLSADGAPRTEQVRLDLSTERGAGLCGGSFGDCDPPTSTTPGAQIYLDIMYFEEGGRSRTGWSYGEPFRFGAVDSGPTELPPQPRIDLYRSGVEPDGRHAITGTARFDRPVSLRTFFVGDPGDLCFTGDAPSFESDGMRADHTFRLDGLCILTSYLVGLEATDATGATSIFSYTPVEPGTFYWDGYTTTEGYHVTWMARFGTALVDPYQVAQFSASVGRDSVHGTVRSQCLTATSTRVMSSDWDEDVEIGAYIRFDDARRVDGGCRRFSGAVGWEGSVAGTLRSDELAAGDEITLRLDVASRGGTDQIIGGIWVTIRIVSIE